ncbi:hypothetical protein K438DRAFT_2119730 [Mycena galopus ATCC 62051]|nr:hypothetical protein K438DRAFT_2119730 [Mycena galopus ATCC 62051]
MLQAGAGGCNIVRAGELQKSSAKFVQWEHEFKMAHAVHESSPPLVFYRYTGNPQVPLPQVPIHIAHAGRHILYPRDLPVPPAHVPRRERESDGEEVFLEELVPKRHKPAGKKIVRTAILPGVRRSGRLKKGIDASFDVCQEIKPQIAANGGRERQRAARGRYWRHFYRVPSKSIWARHLVDPPAIVDTEVEADLTVILDVSGSVAFVGRAHPKSADLVKVPPVPPLCRPLPLPTAVGGNQVPPLKRKSAAQGRHFCHAAALLVKPFICGLSNY